MRKCTAKIFLMFLINTQLSFAQDRSDLSLGDILEFPFNYGSLSPFGEGDLDVVLPSLPPVADVTLPMSLLPVPPGIDLVRPQAHAQVPPQRDAARRAQQAIAAQLKGESMLSSLSSSPKAAPEDVPEKPALVAVSKKRGRIDDETIEVKRDQMRKRAEELFAEQPTATIPEIYSILESEGFGKWIYKQKTLYQWRGVSGLPKRRISHAGDITFQSITPVFKTQVREEAKKIYDDAVGREEVLTGKCLLEKILEQYSPERGNEIQFNKLTERAVAKWIQSWREGKVDLEEGGE